MNAQLKPDSTATSPLTLTAQQSAALTAMLAFARGEHGARMMTLEGYAGTGKTTLVGELLRTLGRQLNIAVAAPTNKAVNVLREKIGADVPVEYGSIHSFMGLRLRERDDGRHECVPEGSSTVHQYNLVIVDECSMLSRQLFGALVATAQHADTRILFVGDPAQLPPVGDRQESPTFGMVQHKAVLTDIVRQAADNPIIAVSMRIREAIEASHRMSRSDIEAACPPPPADALYTNGGGATAYNWALHDIRQGLDTRILAFRNETVLRYNRDIHEAVHGSDTPFAVDEIVMLNDAHDARDATGRRVPLFNSEECVVIEIARGTHPRHDDVPAWRLVLRRDDGSSVVCYVAADRAGLQNRIRQMFADAAKLKSELMAQRDSTKDAERKALIGAAWGLVNDFANVRHVYAMTIHKSQGSTLHTAIVDLGDVDRMRDDFDFNRALYVATTRAAKHLAFVA